MYVHARRGARLTCRTREWISQPLRLPLPRAAWQNKQWLLKANNTLMQASATWRTTTTTPKKSLLLRACSARILNRKIKNSGAKTHSSAFSRFKSGVLLFLLFLALVLFLIMIIFSKRCYCRADDEQLRRQDHKSNFTFFFCFCFSNRKLLTAFVVVIFLLFSLIACELLGSFAPLRSRTNAYTSPTAF